MIVLMILFFISVSFVSAGELGRERVDASSPQKNYFNPSIGVNFLGLFKSGNGVSEDRTITPHNGFSFQESEIQMTSDVDPYFKASALFSVKQESGAADFAFEPEEVFLETTAIPIVTIRAGKFKAAFGKHNLLHTHAFAFIDSHLIHLETLGEEGLNEVGVSGAALLPVSWYSEFIFQIFTSSNETLFKNQKSGETAKLIKLKNLWDLREDLTFEMGLSGTAGKNTFDHVSSLVGADLTLKWRPLEGGKYFAWIWSTEYLFSNRRGFTHPTSGAATEVLAGVVSAVQYQFSQRWWIQGRYENVGIPHDFGSFHKNKQSLLIGMYPSEFSGFRVQVDRHFNKEDDRTFHVISLQYNISLGAHPAHAY